jgi:hypothetical protein
LPRGDDDTLQATYITGGSTPGRRPERARSAGALATSHLGSSRTFTLRTSEGFVENFGPGLIARVSEEAPGVQLRFVQKPDKDSAPPEVRMHALFRDRFIGVVWCEWSTR